MRDAFLDALMVSAAENPRLMLLTGDLGFGAFEPFQRDFPKQFLNVGVAEQNMIGIATGLALNGRVVFAYSIANFSTFRCLEQIRNDVAYHGASVIVVGMGGGLSYGSLGVTHHATEDLAVTRAIPGMTVVSPGTNWEAKEATRALAKSPRPAYLRLEKAGCDAPEHDPARTFSLGKAHLARDGRDITLIATGSILSVALAAAERLKERGIDARVLSMHTVKPLDQAALCRAASETRALITLEEHSIIGGLGSAVTDCLMDSRVMPQALYRIGLRDQFSSVVGDQNYLRERYGISEKAVLECVESHFGLSSHG